MPHPRQHKALTDDPGPDNLLLPVTAAQNSFLLSERTFDGWTDTAAFSTGSARIWSLLVSRTSADGIAALRQAADLSICFVITVLMLQTFVLEGYLISTGSMAPGLRGFHRLVKCPQCDFEFAFGVAFDDSIEGGGILEPAGPGRAATCPNCSHSSIDVGTILNSQGDQLLVHRHVYDLRQPRRWETVVFRSPADPADTFVKRLVGLPQDQLQIVAGDVLINGQRTVRSWQQQLEMRIPVCDLACRPEDADWQLPWELDAAWTCHANRILSSQAPSAEQLAPATPAWIHFRYWRSAGGHHLTETPLAAEDAQGDWNRFEALYQEVPIPWSAQVHYDAAREVLQCEGVLPEGLQHVLLRDAENEQFRTAVFRLAARSHLAPVTDRYGYNSLVASPEYVVNDLMLDTELEWAEPPVSVHVRIPVGSSTFGLALAFETGTAALVSLDSGELISSVQFRNPDLRQQTVGRMQLQVSTFDRQISAAIDGQVLLESLRVHPVDDPSEKPVEASVSPVGGSVRDASRAQQISICHEQQSRWALGIRGGSVQISALRMFRDVFYTPGWGRNAVTSPLQISAGHYFVLGDNSPVSSDSRNWQKPLVPHELLLGRPFLVHLPSRPGMLRLAGFQLPVRIPDRSRIRRIH